MYPFQRGRATNYWTTLLTLWNSLSPLALVCTAIVLLIVCAYAPRWRLALKYRRLPPGPMCWPFVGYLSFLRKEDNHIQLRSLAERYGGVFSLFVGNQFVVVIDSLEALHEAYSMQEFLGRPPGLFLCSPDPRQKSLFDISGYPWEEQHKFFLETLQFTRTNEFKAVYQDQISTVLEKLTAKQGQDVNVTEYVELAVNNVAYNFIYGRTYDHEHIMIRMLAEYDMALRKFFQLRALRFFFPIFGYFIQFLPYFQNARRVLFRMDRYIREEIREHQDSLDVTTPRCFVDAFLIKMNNIDLHGEYNMSTLLANVKLQLAAASNTTRITLVWFFMLMARHAEIQCTIQAQMDELVGREGRLTYADRRSLPLLEAAIMECMRFTNVINLNPARMTTSRTYLQGLDIPKGTVIVHNLYSLCRNQFLWRRSARYDPYRFLSEDRTRIVNPDPFIPFSYGERGCPGAPLARELLFDFSARVLQVFSIFPPLGGVKLDPKPAITNIPAFPFVRFQIRH